MMSFTAEDCSKFRAKGNSEPWAQSGQYHPKDWFYPLMSKVREIGEKCIEGRYDGPVDISLHVSQPHQASSLGAIAARQAFCDIFPSRSPLNQAIKMSGHYSMQIYFRLTRFGGEVGLCWGAWKWQGTKSEMTEIYEDSRDWIKEKLNSTPQSITKQLIEKTSSSGYKFVNSWSEGGSEKSFSNFSEWQESACSDEGASHAIIKTFHPWELDDLGDDIAGIIEEAVDIFSPIFTHVHYNPEASKITNSPSNSLEGKNKIGKRYKKANEKLKSKYSSPINKDPDKIDRANNSHSKLQNDLAEFVKNAGYKPLGPDLPRTPNYDLAWYIGEQFFVAEVKSITEDNEESQLRHGLGQLLQYRMQLIDLSINTTAILVVERKPPEIWERICSSANVVLVWPGKFKKCFEKMNIKRMVNN